MQTRRAFPEVTRKRMKPPARGHLHAFIREGKLLRPVDAKSLQRRQPVMLPKAIHWFMANALPAGYDESCAKQDKVRLGGVLCSQAQTDDPGARASALIAQRLPQLWCGT